MRGKDEDRVWGCSSPIHRPSGGRGEFALGKEVELLVSGSLNYLITGIVTLTSDKSVGGN